MKRDSPRIALRGFTNSVAGMPSRSAYVWSGRTSIIAFVGAWVFFFARLLSPLQYVKYFDRKSQKRKSSDQLKRRLDFHAKKTEVYFLIVLAAFAALYAFDTNVWGVAHILEGRITTENAGYLTLLARLVAAFLLLESFVWLSYYCLWRNFVEPGYTLYHPAEYVILFPVIIVIQVLGFCIALNQDGPVVLVSMIGGDIPGGVWQLQFLGWYYLAVLFSTIQAMVPIPRFKQNSNTAIIGAGDVVTKRLLPALECALDSSDFGKLEIFSLVGTDPLPSRFSRTRLTLLSDENAILGAIRDRFGLVFVATPPDSHIHYVDGLIGTGARIICEKPLTNQPAEIRRLVADSAHLRESIFALSYYSLEKALPFTYFVTERRAYRQFLEASRNSGECQAVAGDDGLTDCIHHMKRSLGVLKSVDVKILEGAAQEPSSSRQKWAHKSSGILFETMIHALLVARRAIALASPETDWPKGGGTPTLTLGHAKEAVSADAITYVGIDMISNDVAIHLKVGAFVYKEDVRRTANLTFQNGTIALDFNKRSMTCQLGASDKLIVQVAERFGNYRVMVELALRHAESGWMGERFDDFDEQLQLLNWLAAIAPQIDRKAAFSYSSQTPSPDIGDHAAAAKAPKS